MRLPEPGQKHDDDCLRRRKEKPAWMYLCTCGSTDEEVQQIIEFAEAMIDD